MCLGVAVAGVMAGAGTAVATAVAYAEPSAPSSQSSTDGAAAKSPSPAGGPSRSQGAQGKTKTIGTPRPAGSAADTAAATSATKDRAPSRVTVRTAPTARVQATTVVRDAQHSALVPDPPVPARIPAPVPTPVTPATTNGVNASAGSVTRSRISSTADVTAQGIDPTKQHVLVIGVDGTNLSKILDDPSNDNFFALMNEGTTAASTIVGHTTLSNPSWTAVLTGVWDTKSGVINNIFTPATYNSWPTVFNQLEGYNPNIETKAIADWDVITDIASAGSIPADEVVFVPHVAGDTNWSQTDAAVTNETVKSIQGGAGYEDVPNFLFSYLVQVDESGHMFGGDSPEYAAAVSRTDDNLGLILDAVRAREAATGEEWTVIVVTDHGHQPQLGIGHGLQSPRETSTFVIAEGADFAAGQMNNKYSIVDVTPTVLTLFGSQPTRDADGVSLTTLGQSQVDPVNLHQALDDAIDSYGWPDIATNVALSLRTLFGSIPYYVNNFTNDISAQLQAVAGQDIFVVSALAGVADAGVRVIGGALFAATDFIGQIVGRLTGAGVIPPSTPTLQPALLPGGANVLA